ncbi:MAG: hypothetical protein Q9191_000715 [Dirinaria sp. TL-2023a]
MADDTATSDGKISHHAPHDELPNFLALDQAVLEILGKDLKICSVNWLKPSMWSTFARIAIESSSGTQKQYFLKCATGDAGKTMLEGEFHSMFEIYKAVPSLVPRPYGYGRFWQDNAITYFLLSDFIEMSEGLPDHVELSKCVASLHCRSQSPTGKFGFFTTTCHGKICQQVAWDSNWTSFYTKLLGDALQKDLETNGRWPVLEEVSSRTLYKVIPRLIGALESGGRSVRPALIHADLWEGNIATEKGTGKIFLIDAGAYYAHSEMEIGMWRCQRHAIRDEKFKNAYLEQMSKSEPTEEWDDRNRLYCVKMNVIHSAHHRGVQERQTAFEDMCYLVNKYAPYTPHELEQRGLLNQFSRAAEAANSH